MRFIFFCLNCYYVYFRCKSITFLWNIQIFCCFFLFFGAFFLQSERIDIAVGLSHLVFDAFCRIFAGDVGSLFGVYLHHLEHVGLCAFQVAADVFNLSAFLECVGRQRVHLYHLRKRGDALVHVSFGMFDESFQHQHVFLLGVLVDEVFHVLP